MPQKRGKIFKATMAVTLIIIISKAIGFVREMVLAAYFGLSVESDAYSMAFTVVNVLVLLFSAGISSSFIPIYTRMRLKKGEGAANTYASSVLNLYILCGLLGSVLGLLFAPAVCGFLWKGSAEGLELIIVLSRAMFPSLAFWAMSGVLCNLLNAREKFVPEQLMGFALSFTVIFSCIFVGTIHSVAIATAVAAVLQVLILVPFLRGVFKYSFGITLDRNIGATFKTAGPALLSMSFDEINHLVDRNLASGIALGAVSALDKSYKLVMLVLGVMVVPITTIMYSRLSRYSAQGKTDLIRKNLKQCTELLAFTLMPVIAMALIFREDLIAVLFQRGQFTAADTVFTAAPFAFYFIGVFSFGLRNFQTRVFFSLRDTRSPMLTGLGAVIINITLNILLSKTMGVSGLTLATTIAGTLNALAMMVILRKKLGKMRLLNTLYEFIKTLIATAVCAMAAYYSHLWLSSVLGDEWTLRVVKIMATCLAGAIVYLPMALLLRIKALRNLARLFKRA